jgi:hypothetical protein
MGGGCPRTIDDDDLADTGKPPEQQDEQHRVLTDARRPQQVGRVVARPREGDTDPERHDANLANGKRRVTLR